jgi:flavin reductase (DIM6/NTAB) family NADH-FMN oxidoreductase RutF
METICGNEQRDWCNWATRHGLRITADAGTLYGRAFAGHRLIGFAALVAPAKESVRKASTGHDRGQACHRGNRGNPANFQNPQPPFFHTTTTMTQPQPNSQCEPADAEATAAALGRIPSGLFVVTWRTRDNDADSTDQAMLASWIMQGGFVPPLITIAVGATRNLLAAIDQCTPFVVNVLGESQRSLVGRFGKPAAPGEDPFAGMTIARSPSGTAVIPEAIAWLECQAVTQAGGSGGQMGDHVIILARVLAAGTGLEQAPLVHVRRNGLRY